MPRRSFHFASLSLLFLAVSGPAGAQDKVTYQDHIRPIFENRCLTCHNPDKKRGDLDLATYGGVMAGGSGGATVDAGDSAASKLWQVVAHTAEPAMPPKSDKIPQAEIDLIARWIAGGVLDTASSSARVKKKTSVAMTATGASQKPEGPPPMPEHLLLEPVVTPPRANAITAMAHSPWAPLLAVAAPRQVLFYHSTTGELLGVLPFPDNGSVETLSFTRNGAMILAGGGVAGKKGIVMLWEVKTGKEVLKLDTGDEHDAILAADISADLSRIATGGPGRKVRIYDSATQQCLTTIKKHTDWITGLAFSPDGVLLATGDRSGGLYVWETGSGNEFYTLKGHEKMIASLAWRPDSNVLAAGSEDENWTWWEMTGGSQIKKTGTHGGVLALGFGPDGRLISGGRDGHARVWDASGNQQRDWVPSRGQMILKTLFNHDGTRVVTGSWDGELTSWDAANPDAPPVLFSANPPAIETRLSAIGKDIAEKQIEAERAGTALKEKEEEAAAATKSIEEMKQALVQFQAEAETAAKEAADIQRRTAQMTAHHGVSVKRLKDTAKVSSAPVSDGAALPVNAPRETAPEDLRAVFDKTAETEAELKDLSSSLKETRELILKDAVRRSEDALAHLAQRRTTNAEAAARLNKELISLQKILPEREQAAEKLAADAGGLKPAAENARDALLALFRSHRHWLAAKENRTVLALRAEAGALAEKVEDLKAEIPALEQEISDFTAKVSAVSTSETEKELKKMQSQLAGNIRRLGEARSELETLSAQAAEKQQVAEEALARYLSMPPE